MLLERIQRDLFDFASQGEPDDFGALMNFWYRANAPALSAALTARPGLKLIVDVPSIVALEQMSKKLFLIADTIVLRGLSNEGPSLSFVQEQLVPISGYTPGYVEDVIETLQHLQPSPLTLMGPTPFWSSTKKKLRDGTEAAYAVQMQRGTPTELSDWLPKRGRQLLESGRLSYAPFIPSLKMEQEFMARGIDLSAYFHTSPCFHHNMDWLVKQQLDALFALHVPCLDGLSLDLLGKVKDDHRGEFEAFSRVLMSALDSVKGAFGTSSFAAEVRHIQRNLIDAGVSDVDRTFKKLTSMSSLRKKGMLIGLVGLDVAACFGAPELVLATGLAAAGVKMVADKIDLLKEQNDIRTLKNYFLWRVSKESNGDRLRS